MAIDLGKLGIAPGCPGLAWVHLKSRASDSVNANLFDLVGPVIDLDTCRNKTFNVDVTPGHIDGLRCSPSRATPSDSDDVGRTGDLGSGEIELTAGDDHDFTATFDPIAPGTLDFHYEVRASDGTTVLLSSDGKPKQSVMGRPDQQWFFRLRPSPRRRLDQRDRRLPQVHGHLDWGAVRDRCHRRCEPKWPRRRLVRRRPAARRERQL